MNKKLGLAVASALFAVATSANAGIVIPAGDWTVDIGGNVNTYYTHTKFSGALAPGGGFRNKANTIQTGLLPSALGIGAKTRQNDLDVAFQFTFFVGADSGAAGSSAIGGFNGGPGALGSLPNGAAGANTLNIRQAFLTFGDKSWGTIKMGRDLGTFGSDAILSDMTLLGVGVGAGAGGSSTLGRIGSGYIYADWVGQIQYASPNFNGFSFQVALREPWTNGSSESVIRNDMGYEGKVGYEWAGDVAGKVWASAISQKHSTATGSSSSYTSEGFDIGGKVSVAGFGLVGYYYDGSGLSGPANVLNGLPFLAGSETDDKGGYVQGTYTIPGIGTKLGASYGISKSQSNVPGAREFSSRSYVIGAYHPLTKSLNLVAEYTDNKLIHENYTVGRNGKAKTVSLGAILFF